MGSQRILSGLLTALYLLVTTSSLSAEQWLKLNEAFIQHKAAQDQLSKGILALGIGDESITPDREAARLHLRSASDSGNPLASLYLSFITTEKSERLRLLRIALDHQLRDAVYPLANQLYQHGYGKPEDFEEALRLFKTASQWHNKDAEFYAGRMYHFGHGTKLNYKQARVYYALAVEHGSARAANNLSNLYVTGDGGSQDIDKAIELLKFASDQGMAMASENLGQRYRTKVSNAPDWINAEIYYKRAVEQSGGKNAEAAYQVGRIAQFAYTSDSPDYARAAKYHQIAADLGHAKAAYRIGCFYRDGTSVKKDIQRAWDYFEDASKEDIDRALFAQGRMIETGQFGVPDYERAMPYYKKAAELGHIQGAANYAWILWELRGTEAEAEIHIWSKKAIEAENQHAMVNYGYLNLYQKLEDSDPEYGLKLTTQAAESGDFQATKNLFHYYSGEDNLIEPDIEQANYWKETLTPLQQDHL